MDVRTDSTATAMRRACGGRRDAPGKGVAPGPQVPRVVAGEDVRGVRRELATRVRRLAGDELELLLLIARRLDAGRSRYGTLHVAHDPRDFSGEALEELADAAVYLGAALLRARKGSAPQ